jgi:hypothetical protein
VGPLGPRQHPPPVRPHRRHRRRRLFDGSKWARFRKTYLPGGLEWCDEADVTVDRDAEGNLLGAFVASGRFVEEADADDERLAGWAADDRAAYTADTARRREERAKADAADTFADLTLRELRARLARAPRPQRTALLANVLAELGA